MEFVVEDGVVYEIVRQPATRERLVIAFEENVRQYQDTDDEIPDIHFIMVGNTRMEFIMPEGTNVVYSHDIFPYQNEIPPLDIEVPYPLLHATPRYQEGYEDMGPVAMDVQVLAAPNGVISFYKWTMEQNRKYLPLYEPIAVGGQNQTCIGLPRADTYTLPSIYGTGDNYLIPPVVGNIHEIHFSNGNPRSFLREQTRPYALPIYAYYGELSPIKNIYASESEIQVVGRVIVSGIICIDDQLRFETMEELMQFLRPHTVITRTDGRLYPGDVDVIYE